MRGTSFLAFVLGAAMLVGCKNESSQGAAPAPSGSTPAPAAAIVTLHEGDVAPTVAMPLQSGKTVHLADFKGKPVAVYFYPKDQTPGCTVEAQQIRDNYTDLQKEGITVIGVSAQDEASHKAFIEKEKLPFDLAIDDKGAIGNAFGVPMTMGYHARHTFLIDKDGKVKKIWRSVKPDGHAQEILVAAKS